MVDPAEVVRRDPQIILASWRGKPVGWDAITAVRESEIHELDGADVLSPGPSLMIGLRRIHEIIQGRDPAREGCERRDLTTQRSRVTFRPALTRRS